MLFSPYVVFPLDLKDIIKKMCSKKKKVAIFFIEISISLQDTEISLVLFHVWSTKRSKWLHLQEKSLLFENFN